jgi:hypothetical protein
MKLMKLVSAAVITLILTTSVAARQGAANEFAALIGLWRAGVEAGVATITIDGTAAPKASAEHAAYFGADGAAFVTAATTPTVFPLAAAKSVKGFTGGRITVEFKLIAGATDQTAGVAFNIKPDHSYLYARYNTKDGNVAIWKYEKGERTVLAHGELHEQLPFSAWHTLSVNIAGRTVTANVNDKFKVAHTIDRDVNGGVGLWTKADSVTAFRHFSASATR